MLQVLHDELANYKALLQATKYADEFYFYQNMIVELQEQIAEYIDIYVDFYDLSDEYVHISV